MFVTHVLALVLERCCLSCSLYKEISSCGQQLISLLFCQLMACRKRRKPVTVGRLSSTKNTRAFEIGANGVKISLETFGKIRKLLNPLDRKFRKLREKNQMERKFSRRRFRKFGHTSRDCLLFQKF